MPPHSIRPSGDEETPKRAPRGRAKPAAAKPTAASRRGMNDAELRAALVDGYQTLGTLEAGAGYMRGNPGLALAGFNTIARAEESADIDMKACKANPRLRDIIVRMLDGGVMAAFFGNKAMLAAPVLAALVPHPAARFVANQSIHPDAHAAAMAQMPELFMQPPPESQTPPTAPPAADPGDATANATDGQT